MCVCVFVCVCVCVGVGICVRVREIIKDTMIIRQTIHEHKEYKMIWMYI